MSLNHFTTNIKITLGTVLATFVVASGVAMAGTANTPVGQLTATQVAGPCNDLGANVTVAVASGFTNTPYKATGPTGSTPANFTTNGNGAGHGLVTDVLPGSPTGKGTVTITVKAAGKVGQVPVDISCAPGK